MIKTYTIPESVTAKEIKELRKRLGMTQKEFAAFIQCSKATIERWERSKEPLRGMIAFIINILQVYPEYVQRTTVPEKTMPIRLWYMHNQTVCTLIDVNEMKREIRIKNYTDNIMFRAFGTVEEPDFDMYTKFLKSRCFPESRDKMKLILKDLELPFYDPFMIIERTEGRMAEDDFWVRIER